jgi:hypothetical protein
MEVLTELNGRKYRYKSNGLFYTWVDERNLPIPVIVHTSLREKALSEGVDESIFLSNPKSPHSEKTLEAEEPKVTKNQKKKTNSTGSFNPFKQEV